MIVLYVILAAAALVFGGAYICCRMAFGVDRAQTLDSHNLMQGEQYDPLHDEMMAMVLEADALVYEDVWMVNREGLRLHARYYEVDPKAPLELMFHGYRANAVRDFSGGITREIARGWNLLLVDQRAHGQSEGRYLSFGVKERYDCLDWINWANGRFGADKSIVLAGISMGAATVLMAAGLELPDNVRGVLADSGYTSPRAIIRSVMRSMHCPAAVYPLLRFGGRLYGGFDIDSASAEGAMADCRVPVLFVHGEDDRFVPCEMGRRNWAACTADKTLLTIPGAGHGLSYLIDKERYETVLTQFLNTICPEARAK